MNKQEALNILGLTTSATEKEIDKAFRSLASKHHPDVNGGNEEKFKQINSAYQELKKPDEPQNPFGGNPFNIHNVNLNDDLFNQLFNMGFVNRNIKVAIIDIELTFKEAALGCSKDISYSYQKKCDVCKSIIKKGSSCYFCNGNGTVLEKKVLSVKIPAVGKIDFIKVAGAGNYIRTQGNIDIYGELGIRIKLIPDSRMEFVNNSMDISSTEKISLLDALKGTTLDVETVHGIIKLKIPPKTKSGSVFAAKLKGGFYGQGFGNHLFKIDVEYPEVIDNLIKVLEEDVNHQNEQ